jgi:hypothetical protein
MAFPGSNLDALVTKLSATTMVMQALVAQLREKGLLANQDLEEMKAKTLVYTGFLKEHGGSGSQVAGVRIEKDLDVFFELLKQ